jgi:hypothetical protein
MYLFTALCATLLLFFRSDVYPGGRALGILTAREMNQVHPDGDLHLTPTQTVYRIDEPYIYKYIF